MLYAYHAWFTPPASYEGLNFGHTTEQYKGFVEVVRTTRCLYKPLDWCIDSLHVNPILHMHIYIIYMYVYSEILVVIRVFQCH